MRRILESAIQRWQEAGLMDLETASRIQAFENERGQPWGLRWLVLAAWSFGGLLVLSGTLLFISAHWDEQSPGQRMATVLAGVALFHLFGALVSKSQPILARVFHAIGTATCGAGIFLAAQIFHLEEHWPAGFLLWSAGAAAGWFFLRDWVQASMAAVLLPIWLIGEWVELTRFTVGGHLVAPAAAVLLSLIYFTAPKAAEIRPFYLALSWIGGLALFPSLIILGEFTTEYDHYEVQQGYSGISISLLLCGWMVLVIGALVLAFVLKRSFSWISVVAAAWVVVVAHTSFETTLPYLLCGLASLGMMWWGIAEERRERINFGVCGFGLTVLFFYFSNVMDKLDRSLGLIGFGVLFIVLGYALTRLRGRLMKRLEEVLS